jgi:hypothetical protein
VACCEKLLPKGKSRSRLRLYSGYLPFCCGLTCNYLLGFSSPQVKLKPIKEALYRGCIRLIASYEWQTPLVARFYLNISYGRFYVNFRPRGEAVNRTSLKRFNGKGKWLVIDGSHVARTPVCSIPVSLSVCLRVQKANPVSSLGNQQLSTRPVGKRQERSHN